MLNKINDKIKKWFSRSDEDLKTHLPEDEKATFILTVDNMSIGELHCENGIWEFKYSEEFKKHRSEYALITGFPDISKTYKSVVLWPFFQIRIPGLKQAAVRELIEKEHIDKENEVALLKRFGQKTIANPYELKIA